MQISSLYLRKRNAYTERKVYPYLRSEDLRLDLLPHARALIAAKRAGHPWLVLSEKQLLRDSGLYLRDIETGQVGYTRAAALLLGTDETTMSVCPAYKVDALLRVDNIDRYDDRLVLKTKLIANFFTQIGRAEDLGSGTRNLYKYVPVCAGRDPELADGDMFTARVWTTFAGVQSAKGRAPLDAELLPRRPLVT